LIRVVHLITRTNIGGPSVIVGSLLDDTAHPDIEQSLVRGGTSIAEGDYFAHSNLANKIVTVAPLGRRVRPWDDLRALVSLVRYLKTSKPDVVHTHMAKAGALGRLAAFIARVPVRIHTYHGHLLTGYFSPVVTKLFIVVERALRRITTHVVVVGHQVRRDLIAAKVVDEKRSRVINPGIVEFQSSLSTLARQALGLPAEGVVVAYVGRFAQIKRPDRFVQLARQLSTDPGIHFLMVGDGPLLGEVREACAGLPQMLFLPWQHNLPLLLSAVDLVVMCSDNEGVPLLLIEAGMASRPVVTTNVGSVSDVVADGVNGLLVDRDDQAALADAVRRLVDDADLRSQLGAAGRAHALRDFTVNIANSAHAEMYRELVTAARDGRSARRPR